ncbi:hypothetical protein [Myxosarcina sp. GI1]|uniref:hypothetical protein n=1 Tax=Myxosarcina sp. GI1 TaxID=1541065 RepID=UPI000567DED0|nr:hypothetical protein [Myxosarcina sp. GI1]
MIDSAKFRQQVEKLYNLTVYLRWLFVLFCWLTLGVYGIWQIKNAIALWFDYFTWSAVYYTFHFHLIPTLCLAFCVGVTVSTLVRQSKNIIWGIPKSEKKQLEKRVKRILAVGTKHPLWKWISK